MSMAKRGLERKTGGSGRLGKLREKVHGPSAGICMDEVDASALTEAVSRVVEAGAAIMFGITSDGGALCITVLDDGEKERVFAASASEAEAAFRHVTSIYKTSLEKATAEG